MRKENEIKETGESVLDIQRMYGEVFRDNRGQLVRKTRWERAEVPISLGSMREPKQDIAAIRIRTPQKNPMGFGFFGG